MSDAHDENEFDWDSIYHGDGRDHMPPDPLILELTADLPVGDALDVGCGAGGLLLALARRGWKVSGIDIAPKAIAAARRVLSDHGVHGELEVADAASWTPPRAHDLVTNTFALPMRRPRQIEAFRTIRSATAPGGVVILKDFDPAMSRHAPSMGYDGVTVEHLTEAFEGFEILRAETVSTPAHDHHHGTYGEEAWTASLLVARRPVDPTRRSPGSDLPLSPFSRARDR